MSGVANHRASTMPNPGGGGGGKGPHSHHSSAGSINANGSATLSFPGDASDDISLDENEGQVTLEVILPDSRRTDITVDYHTPMLDLLVHLAAKCRLSPSGLRLQLLGEDGESELAYKPNQSIGSLDGRLVRLVDKKAQKLEKYKKKDKKPFEMTNRFIVNLPRGQKTVLRVSSSMPLSQIVSSVCREKELDLKRHRVQVPAKPGAPVDLNATVAQLGGNELSIVSLSSLQERNYTTSMPDLTQVPKYMPAEPKKKKGFFSFLRRDKKLKIHDKLETSSTSSHQMSTARSRQSFSPTPPTQRRMSDSKQEHSRKGQPRPKSMFVSSNPSSSELALTRSELSNSQVIVPPARKKRRAPAPPTPRDPAMLLGPDSSSKRDINANERRDNKSYSDTNLHISTVPSTSSVHKENVSGAPKPPSAHSRVEQLSRLHSRNSSDSSGYHELTLSGCESPEAGHTLTSKSKSSIDSTSIESSEITNGTDSGIHDSPVRVSPIEEVLEKSESSSLPAIDKDLSQSTLPSTARKKKKAPAPPAPPAPSIQIQIQPPVPDPVVTSAATEFPHAKDQSVQESTDVVLAPEPEEATTNHSNIAVEVISPPASFNDDQPTHTDTPAMLHMSEDPDLSDEDVNTAFDIDDILNNVTFEDQPRPLKMPFLSLEDKNDNDMMMMETSSVLSEDIEQSDSVSKSERPCAFIPPPPPSEPPPPELEKIDIPSPVLVDKETEVNEDNTSLAPRSVKNSPEPVSQDGYKNEMALFVERMSKLTSENQEEEANQFNDSLSSGVSASETNSDTGSVIRHLRTDSSDSKSGLDSGSWSKKDFSKLDGVKKPQSKLDSSNFKVTEEISIPEATVPPPSEFGDKKEKREDNIEEEEEEEYTEIIEEVIIPMGPEGYDFSSAKSKTVSEVYSSDKQSPGKEEVLVHNGLFRAEPVSIKQQAFEQSKELEKTENKPVSKPAEKEEFVLTLDDLSSVSFLPPRPKLASRVPEQKQEDPHQFVSSATLIHDKSSPQDDKDRNVEVIQSRVSQLSFNPMSEQETDSVLEEKPISLLQRLPPVLQNSTPSKEGHLVYSSHKPQDVHISPQQSSFESSFQSNGLNHHYSDDDKEISSHTNILHSNNVVHENGDRPDSKASVYSHNSTDQYDELQEQFTQWKNQLASNDTILSQTSGSHHLYSSPTDIKSQQQMVNHSNGDKEFPIKTRQEAAATEPPPPPPPPATSASVASIVSSNKLEKSKPKGKSRFERDLDPREQLMIAIRTFQGREGLKPVAKRDTKWIHSNRL